jgi:hypothetical protein
MAFQQIAMNVGPVAREVIYRLSRGRMILLEALNLASNSLRAGAFESRHRLLFPLLSSRLWWHTGNP